MWIGALLDVYVICLDTKDMRPYLKGETTVRYAPCHAILVRVELPITTHGHGVSDEETST